MDALKYYDLDGNLIDIRTWLRMLEDLSLRRIAEDDIDLPGGGVARVSTVWLGLDHNWLGHGPPLIFETMVFFEADNYGSDDFCVRSATRETALDAHALGIRWAQTLGLDTVPEPRTYSLREESDER